MSPIHGWLELSVRGLHVAMVGAWLLFDFVVYWLHFKIKDAAAPLDERLERARVMHGIDTVVAYLFFLTLPVGVALCYLTDTPLFTTEWLNWKHLMYGLIVVAAIVLVPISGTALRNLKAIKGGAANFPELNDQIKRDMNWAMPWVFLIWTLITGMIVISAFNAKCPHCNNFILR
ncbi:MAG: hypothetical protein JJE39_05420 [Vicinamibacteria bacterium]|nr:hypothetical protein [Vicinamibacteria bacterium]